MGLEILIIIGTLVLIAEVTYLIVKLPRQINGKKRQIFVDTSVLIDGRIVPVAASGFVGDTLVVPRSVIGELQFLADNADAEKRARARHGLDVVQELQAMENVDVQILQDGSKAEEGVDERLLKLAKKHGGAICTIDYNLNKVAVVEGIVVCNVNELAKNLRMAYLPGEKIMLEIVQKGQDNHQGVGYLPDGTMVVVEQAFGQIGQTIEIEFIRSLQTAAGKMMFAKKTDNSNNQKPKQLAKKPIGTKQVKKEQKPQVAKPQQPSQKPQQQKPVQPQVASQPKQQSSNQSRQQKPRRSKDREASLIELVEKQNS